MAWAAFGMPPAQASQSSSQLSSPSQQDDQSPSGSSSSKPVHHGTVRHTRIREDNAPPPELAEAEDFIARKNYEAAEPLLWKVVQAAPDNYVGWFDLGFVENGLGKLSESIAAYRKSVEAKPDVFESNLNLGLQLAKGNQPDAEQYLREATILKPTSNVADGQARAWISLGHVLERTKPDEALVAYHRAAALQPKDEESHLAAGQLLERQNKFADAEQEYNQALSLNPASDALTGLANIAMNGHQFPEAATYLRKLVAVHPDDASAHIQLGRVLAAETKYDEAIPELQAGAKLAPADVSVQRDLADLYAMAGKNTEAEAAYRGLLSSHPNDAKVHHGLGKVLLHEKKPQDAQQEFLTAVKLKPDFGEAYGDLALAASDNKNYLLTLKALDARAKLMPEEAQTYFLRASAYDHLKDVKKASENYHLFLKVANGKYPDQEWQAKHRLIAIEPKK
jgi:tetratricopeptide (TPR) repeat protein